MKREQTKVVRDNNTIYEIDLDCLKKKSERQTQNKRSLSRRQEAYDKKIKDGKKNP